jgi:chromosome segregation ATPase
LIRPWCIEQCYNRFVPSSWDDYVWDCVYALLKDDAWLEQQLASGQSQGENMAKLLKLHRYKISQAQSKIARVREGFEGGIYSLDEAKQRVAECEAAIAKAEQESKRLQTEMNRYDAGAADIEATKRQLKALRERNLEDASFEDKLDMITKVGIRSIPRRI